MHDLPRIIKEAFHIATTGRPGPVVIDIPKDMVQRNVSDLIDVQMIYQDTSQLQPNHTTN